MTENNVLSLATAETRSAAREAAFRYAFHLQEIARALRADKALTNRRLARKFHAAAKQLRAWAGAADRSERGRVFALCLNRYADMLRAKALRPNSADELDAEAQREMNTERSIDDEKA